METWLTGKPDRYTCMSKHVQAKAIPWQNFILGQRKYAHASSAFNEKASDYNSQFHQAIRKYGLENFDYEVIAQLSPDEYSKKMLDELETYFIKYYNSYQNGYNATAGGDDNPNRSQKGEANGRARLKESDIRYIRECYNAHIPFREIYEEYQDKISKRGLQKVWWFQTWQDILPEYHTEENKYWHSHNAKANSSEVARNNTRKFTPDEVRKMRDDFDSGMTPKQVWLKYSPESAWSTIYNIINKI